MPITALLTRRILPSLLAALLLMALPASAASIEDFIGAFEGNVEFDNNGTVERRDMSVEISETKDGFSVNWTSVTYKPDGRTKEKSYTIAFQPSERDNIFASAMKSNVFGKQVPLNPLKGEPFVWSRIQGDTLTVFSLFIDEAGDYEMQEYHRTLADGGLQLEFRRFSNGNKVRTIETFLTRK
jgi:hypothetical protein